MVNKQPSPPKIAVRLLQWFCRADLLDEIQGDLYEQFQRQVVKHGLRNAKWHYLINVISFIRPFALKKTRNNSTKPTIMFRHNLLLTYRNFKRFKSSFFINLIGLSTGLATAFLIYLWVNDELHFDKFHKKDSQLFQIMTNHVNGNEVVTLGDSPGLLEEAMNTAMPEVDYATSSSRIENDFTLSVNDNRFNAAGHFVSRNYFNTFSYDLVQGDKDLVLTDKNAIVMSEQMAVNLFGTTENILGKIVEWQSPYLGRKPTSVKLTGIFKDLPVNSSDQFDFVLSYDFYKDLRGESIHWGNHNAITYLVLREGTDVDQFNEKIARFAREKIKNPNYTLFVQRYSEKYLYGRYANGKVAGGRIEYVRLFSIIALFILIMACINFMNLSTAKSARRIKEVGIKKAVGAGRKSLIFQYLGESVMISFLSLMMAFLAIILFLPQFNEITGKHLTLDFTPSMLLSVLGITLATGLLAGSYPALYLSAFRPALVLKGKVGGAVGEFWARKGLVVFQLTLSVILTVSVLVIFQQVTFIQTKHLGYNKDNIIYFKNEGRAAENLETFLSEVTDIPGVLHASGMWGSVVGMPAFTTGWFDWEGRNHEEIVRFEHLGIYYDMIEMLDIEMKEGRAFSPEFNTDSAKIIFNEAGIKIMGLQDPVGKVFNLWGKKMEIVGVVKDFHFKSLHENVKPLFLRLITPEDAEKTMIKIEAGSEKETLERIQEFYKAYNPGYPFEYRFLDEEYQAQYEAEKRVATLSRYFAGFAMLISCLGLFGLSAFTAERRLKEIGIRKILGAGFLGIIYLLSRDFTRMVLTAIVIALPLSYLLTKNWLDNFAYRIALEWWFFVGAGFLALLITWLTVGIQTVKAAKINPSECLKDE